MSQTCCADEQKYLPPNVLLVTMDTTRADHLGCYGYDRNTTPNIDGFANDAVKFTNAVSVIPLTTPSHATIMTGLYPENHQVYRNSYRVHNDFTMMAEILKKEGYTTGAFVSAVVVGSRIGFKQGFDFFSDVPKVRRQRESEEDADVSDENTPRPFFMTETMFQRRGDHTTDDALKWFEMLGTYPFFAWVHFYDPHLSYTPPDEYGYRFNPDYHRYLKNISNPLFRKEAYADQLKLDEILKGETITVKEGFDLLTSMFSMNQGKFIQPKKMTNEMVSDFVSAYDGELAFTDDQVSRLFQLLRDMQQYENTVIIIVGDHGEILYEKEDYFGHHRYLYEGSMAVPLLMKIPGVRPQIIEESIDNADILVTLLDILDIDSSVSMDGKSFWPLISGSGEVQEVDYRFYGTHTGKRKDDHSPTKPILVKIHNTISFLYHRGIRRLFMKLFRLDRKWKIEKHFDRIAVVKGPWKLIRNDVYREKDKLFFELYNLENDPLEEQNLVESEENVYKEMKTVLKRHIKKKRLRVVPAPDLHQSDEEKQEEIQTLRSLGYM